MTDRETFAFDEFARWLIKNDIVRAAPECGHYNCIDNHFTTKIDGEEYYVSIYLNGPVGA